MNNNPIGIFDSGIGGLTVAHAIQKLLPNENMIYFGDIAHLPYGDKSRQAVQNYALNICDFLIYKKCKIIVIACNTASALAFELIKKKLDKQNIEVINVIDPVVEYVDSMLEMNKIGIICTKATAKSGAYRKKIKNKNSNLKTSTLATPLLVPMIEEGYFNNKVSQTIINNYLSNHHLKNIDALILGCTHYPLILKQVENYYQQKVEVIDSASCVAQFVKKKLEKLQLLRSENATEHHFYVSDYTSSFEETTKHFFKNKIKLELINIHNE